VVVAVLQKRLEHCQRRLRGREKRIAGSAVDCSVRRLAFLATVTVCPRCAGKQQEEHDERQGNAMHDNVTLHTFSDLRERTNESRPSDAYDENNRKPAS
jgi:hypothetical protein